MQSFVQNMWNYFFFTNVYQIIQIDQYIFLWVYIQKNLQGWKEKLQGWKEK